MPTTNFTYNTAIQWPTNTGYYPYTYTATTATIPAADTDITTWDTTATWTLPAEWATNINWKPLIEIAENFLETEEPKESDVIELLGE